MFVVNCADLDCVLKDFGITSEIKHISEIQRYDYEQDCLDEKVRLIVKAELMSGPPLVVRFKNEPDAALGIIESQSRFADRLRENGIITPHQYQSNRAFAKWYKINRRNVIVTVEQFAEHEITAVDPIIAAKTGELLAKTHSISEKNGLHAHGRVLFDPFAPNELFDVETFQSLGPVLSGHEKTLFDRIAQRYSAYMEILAPLKKQPRYAVQGDISNCNLYQTCSGEIGIFDFNRCGDNNLFCDAVMQAVFEARLMDYPDGAGDDVRVDILRAFLNGYRSVRDFSSEERQWYPYLYAIIDAFWSSDIKWNEDSLISAVKNGDVERTEKWLEIIWQRLIRSDQSN